MVYNSTRVSDGMHCNLHDANVERKPSRLGLCSDKLRRQNGNAVTVLLISGDAVNKCDGEYTCRRGCTACAALPAA
jgi:hypothetical protein